MEQEIKQGDYKHIPYKSIGQYKQVVKAVRDSAKKAKIGLPVIKFIGTEKHHGTNAAVCFKPVENIIWFQSRERVLSLIQDNAGFCAFGEKYKDRFIKLCKNINRLYPSTGVIQVYGEWAGSNIQKSVGLNNLQKTFFIFDIRISEDEQSENWFTKDKIIEVLAGFTNYEIRHVYEFKTWEIDIDFNYPGAVQNKLIEFTDSVEQCSPTCKALVTNDVELIGEGIVWRAVSSSVNEIDISGMMMKVKGEKHSVSKVKTLAEVDETKVSSVEEFVEATCTSNRLKQGVEVLKERGLAQEPKNTGEFLRWIIGDIVKEEQGMLDSSCLTIKDVSPYIVNKAKVFWNEV